MDGYHSCRVVSLIVTLLVATILACAIGLPDAEEEVPPARTPIVSEADGSTTSEAIPTEPAPQGTPSTTPTESGRSSDAPSPTPIHPPAGPAIDKWSLWIDGPHLRGANIYWLYLIDVNLEPEMVARIAAFTRAQRPGFVVIAQNAAELAEDDDYLAVIDAIAQEQIWFDGGADNDPPGDCPLPRTDAEVDTQAYRNSLSPPCRKQYDEYPDSTPHVNSEEYLRYLTAARDKGEIIFTVDYASEPENVAWVYQTSRALGFVPFVSNRALDRYMEPMP